MILIVDSGSTKTDWCFLSHSNATLTIQTKGINPVVQSQEEIRQTIAADLPNEALQKAVNLNDVDQIHYYGAGCVADKTHIIAQMLRRCIPRECGNNSRKRHNGFMPRLMRKARRNGVHTGHRLQFVPVRRTADDPTHSPTRIHSWRRRQRSGTWQNHSECRIQGTVARRALPKLHGGNPDADV